MPAKRVLVLTENFPPKSGGSGRWFWELYSRLPKEQFIVVTDEVADSSVDNEIENTVIRIPLSSSEWGFKSVIGLKFYWRSARAIKKLVKQYDITEIHCGRVIHEGVIAWLVSLTTKVSVSCFIHGEDIETAATSREHHLMVNKVCAKSKHLICNSLNSQNIARRLGFDYQNTLILHPGADCSRFVPAACDKAFRQKMGWHERKVILTVGRLQARKGHDKMIEAMQSILKQEPNALYCMVGSGSTKPYLEELIDQYGLTESVVFLDEISDQEMIQCYQQCDLFILPNRTIDNDIEGFGMVLVEAQACAKVVIAGDSGGTKETMLPNETGFVIDCTDAEIIASTIIELLGNSDKRERMGSKGREFVSSTFDWLPHVEKAKEIFSQ
ncbi:glycosyltransferase family 4 protein [Brumicola blandensis]|uniref:Glycosyltransferase family 4 protein n=1 Tax=Brumicola blandensis TaxID=3075611 RepID=A0AAW8R3G7_9ALTE|nr:glycosyltransferase family 4 protein [Alteromonas sp. W409]MDT0582625.1 glycosyltransferase family 4 protein [Alteromonas sp. W409]